MWSGSVCGAGTGARVRNRTKKNRQRAWSQMRRRCWQRGQRSVSLIWFTVVSLCFLFLPSVVANICAPYTVRLRGWRRTISNVCGSSLGAAGYLKHRKETKIFYRVRAFATARWVNTKIPFAFSSLSPNPHQTASTSSFGKSTHRITEVTEKVLIILPVSPQNTPTIAPAAPPPSPCHPESSTMMVGRFEGSLTEEQAHHGTGMESTQCTYVFCTTISTDC